MPRIIFSNSKDEAALKVDDLTSVNVARKGTPQLSPRSHIFEDEVFDGKSNHISYNRTYELQLSCDFDLHKFPFDYQTCYIIVSLITKLTTLRLLFFILVTSSMSHLLVKL